LKNGVEGGFGDTQKKTGRRALVKVREKTAEQMDPIKILGFCEPGSFKTSSQNITNHLTANNILKSYAKDIKLYQVSSKFDQ